MLVEGQETKEVTIPLKATTEAEQIAFIVLEVAVVLVPPGATLGSTLALLVAMVVLVNPVQ
jgi:hypothetical protein